MTTRASAAARSSQDAFVAAYPELSRLAHARLRRDGRPDGMQTTTLLHESFLRLTRTAGALPEERAAFFAYASRTMRSVIVDALRERQAQRRGGDVEHVTLDTAVADGVSGEEAQVLQVHEALDALEQVDPRMARVVEMRYFGGWTDDEIAQALDVTDRTVRRDWERARLLLSDALRP